MQTRFMYNQSVLEEIKNIFLKNQHSIAVAESVTSGHLQAALSSAENASKFFQGGITAYNLGQKTKHLQVEPIHADSCNCVSEKIAVQMALEVTTLFTSDWGIAITGYAAPVPECSIHNLFAYYAITYQKKLLQVKKITAAIENPIAVQIHYVNHILGDFVELLRKGQFQSSFSINDLNSINSRLASAGPLSTSPSIE